MALPTFAGRSYDSNDIALMWALPVETVRAWVRNGDLPRSRDGRITRNELLKFASSPEGQSLLREAREG